MDQQMDLSALSRQQVDPEVFRRVWARVMPDQSKSPIQVDVPGVSVPARQEAFPAPAPASRPDEELLKERMDQLREGSLRLQVLLRRMGNRQGARTLSNLLEGCRQTMRQLTTDYFLAAGRRYQPSGGAPAVNPELALALREQFLWARDWIRDSLQAAEQCAGGPLRELCGQLAQEGEVHARAIRTLLEQMQG